MQSFDDLSLVRIEQFLWKPGVPKIGQFFADGPPDFVICGIRS